MKLISHRGNLRGRIAEYENKPLYIMSAIEHGFEVEIDVWYVQGNFYLGHDEPQYKVSSQFLQNSNLWCHAKNYAALEAMSMIPNVHYFWHQEDEYTITSKGFIWVYPGKTVPQGGILVIREGDSIPLCGGVCADNVQDICELLVQQSG